jgi:HK97 family phage portal protein
MATRSDVRRKLAGARYRNTGMQLGRRGNLRSRDEIRYLLDEEWPAAPTVYPATETEAMALPPFGRGVALLANAVAATNWHAERFDPELGVTVPLPDQPTVVTDPDPTTTTWNYRWAATEDGILYGNHFAFLGDMDFRTLRPGWLVPIPADEVWILTDPGNPGWYEWTIGGATFGPDEILHVAYGNRSGEILGRGALRQYCESLGQYVAAESYSGGYFAGGTLPPAVLQSPSVVTEEQATELKTKWRALTSTREPVVLPQGYLLTPIVSNAEQAQLVESRTWNAELIAMLLGIPPWKLGLQGPTMTYANVETADIDFVRDSVDRYGRALCAGFSKWLMPRGTEVVFEYASRMRADQRTTATVLTMFTNAGVLTKDEARQVLGRAPLPEEAEPEPEPEPPADDAADDAPPPGDVPSPATEDRTPNRE